MFKNILKDIVLKPYASRALLSFLENKASLFFSSKTLLVNSKDQERS